MPRQIPVRCVQTGETFSSIREAAQAMGTYAANIYAAIRYGYRTHGLNWEPAREQDRDRQERTVRRHKSTPVRRQDGTVFASVKAAAKACGLSKESIYAAISRRRRKGTPQRAGGWDWDYIDNSEHV